MPECRIQLVGLLGLNDGLCTFQSSSRRRHRLRAIYVFKFCPPQVVTAGHCRRGETRSILHPHSAGCSQSYDCPCTTVRDAIRHVIARTSVTHARSVRFAHIVQTLAVWTRAAITLTLCFILSLSLSPRCRGLVAAGLKDLSRPAEKISIPQNLALTATGFIWVRYSFVITPVNYSLAAVNLFVGSTGLASLYRAWDWRQKTPAQQAAVKAEREAKELADKAKEAVGAK